MKITPKNWSTFQHYKDRKPPWIKLHHDLLDNYEFFRMPVASRALAPVMWLLASEYKDGEITSPLEAIAFRLRMPLGEFCEALHPLVEAGFFNISDNVAKRLRCASGSHQNATPEEETEAQVKTEAELMSEPSSDARKRNSYPVEFEDFWKSYPTDALMSKKQAYDVWKRMTPEDRAMARSAVPAFVEHCKKNPDYRPIHAVRFLSQRRFDGFAPTEQDREAELRIEEDMRARGYEWKNGKWQKSEVA